MATLAAELRDAQLTAAAQACAYYDAEIASLSEQVEAHSETLTERLRSSQTSVDAAKRECAELVQRAALERQEQVRVQLIGHARNNM